MVKQSHLKFLVVSIPLFSQGRENHAAVVFQDTIILVGGSDEGWDTSNSTLTGEILKSKLTK